VGSVTTVWHTSIGATLVQLIVWKTHPPFCLEQGSAYVQVSVTRVLQFTATEARQLLDTSQIVLVQTSFLQLQPVLHPGVGTSWQIPLDGLHCWFIQVVD